MKILWCDEGEGTGGMDRGCVEYGRLRLCVDGMWARDLGMQYIDAKRERQRRGAVWWCFFFLVLRHGRNTPPDEMGMFQT